MSVPTFVVGTGRCGSTMLSNMLREHPRVLSLSEFFANVCDGNRSAEPFSTELMDGPRFWPVMSTKPQMVAFGLRHGVPCDEWLYAVDSRSARFTRETGVPAILVAALPHLTDDYDALFDNLAMETASWSTARIGEHYAHLFHRLAEGFGKSMWIERSGGGIAFVASFLRTFPDARFIHIARDGRDAALSMQKHNAIRLFFVMQLIEQVLEAHPLDSPDRSRVERLPRELQRFLPECFDAAAFSAYHVPLAYCGSMWSLFLEMGMTHLRSLPADRLLTLRYEDILANPKRQLDTLTIFLGEEFIDENWSARCAATVRPPKSTWRDLPPDEIHALTNACRPGFDLLASAGVRYEM